MDRLNDPQLRPTFNRATHGAYAPVLFLKLLPASPRWKAAYSTQRDLPQPGYYQLALAGLRPRQCGQPSEFDFKRRSNFQQCYFVNYGLKVAKKRF